MLYLLQKGRRVCIFASAVVATSREYLFLKFITAAMFIERRFRRNKVISAYNSIAVVINTWGS